MSTPATSTGRRRGPWRWFVALLATVLLVVSGSGLVAFAQSGSSASKGPVWVPADAEIYVVGRLDMPDGQGDALAQFMTAFPGFADPAAFDLKKNELIDGLLSQATNGAVALSGELDSIITGEVGLAMSGVVQSAMTNETPQVLAGIAISDREAAQSFVDLMTAGGSPTDEAYGGTTIVSNDEMAIAVHDEWVLISQTVDQVKAGIDVLEGTAPSLADEADFQTAFTRVPTAHLAAMYMDLGSFASLIDLAGAAAGGQAGLALPMEDLAAQLPESMTAYVAAENDRLTLEAFVIPGEQTQSFAMGESDLATLFPADTQLYVETRELGATLGTAVESLLATMPEEQMAQMAPMEDMLGVPFSEFLDFVSDASIGASVDSDGVWLGIAAEVTDEATAAARVERILSIIRLVGAGFGGGEAPVDIDISESTVGEHTVTTITVPISDAMGASPVPIDIGDEIDITIADGTLLIGTGDFVENALTQSDVDSLALSPGYTDAIGEQTANAGVLYADVSSLLTELDGLISTMAGPQWAQVQPYASGIDRLSAVGSVDDEVMSTKISVIVDQ